MVCPNRANTTMTTKATSTAWAASRLRIADDRPLVRLRNSGMVPGGSMITKSVTKTSPNSLPSEAVTASGGQDGRGAARLGEQGVDDRGIRGVLTEAVLLAAAVVVARPGDQQVELGGERTEPGPGLGRVVAVVHLEAGQPGGGHRGDGVLAHRPAALGGCRVSEHRHSPGLADEPHGADRVDVVVADEELAAVVQQGVERRRPVGDDTGGDQGVGDVRAADGRAVLQLGEHQL